MAGPFDSPLVRYGIGFSGAAVIAAVAVLYLEGTVRQMALAVALVDALVTPQILKRVAQ